VRFQGSDCNSICVCVSVSMCVFCMSYKSFRVIASCRAHTSANSRAADKANCELRAVIYGKCNNCAAIDAFIDNIYKLH